MEPQRLDWGAAQIVDVQQLPHAIAQLTSNDGWQIHSIFPHMNALKMPVIVIVINRPHVEESTDGLIAQ